MGSNKDFPISKLLYFIKLLAIAPPIIIKSTFLIKLEIKSILVDIFEPPIIQVTGLFDLLKIFSKEFNSLTIVSPAYDFINLVIPVTDA